MYPLPLDYHHQHWRAIVSGRRSHNSCPPFYRRRLDAPCFINKKTKFTRLSFSFFSFSSTTYALFLVIVSINLYNINYIIYKILLKGVFMQKCVFIAEFLFLFFTSPIKRTDVKFDKLDSSSRSAIFSLITTKWKMMLPYFYIDCATLILYFSVLWLTYVLIRLTQ